MIFELTRRVRKPDNTMEEQAKVVQCSSLLVLLDWLTTTPLLNIEGLKIEQSKITSIDIIPDPPPIP